MVEIPQEWIWIVVVGFLVAFILCLGIGANDVANTFGTSVGAKVLTLRQACILATIFETAGAVFLGAKVSETIRKGIIDIEPYTNSTEQFLLGNVAALSGSAIWLIIATAAKLPVSATHSIVGATVGFALVANGASGIDWIGLVKIIASWFISPVLSGLITIAVFLLCDYCILRKMDPLESGLRWLPIFYAVTIVINVFSIFYEGPEMFKFDRIPLWGVFILSFGTGLIVAVLVRLIFVPWQRKKIIEECHGEYMKVKNAAMISDIDVSCSVAQSTAAMIPDDGDKDGKHENGILSQAYRSNSNMIHPESNATIQTLDAKQLEKETGDNKSAKYTNAWTVGPKDDEDDEKSNDYEETNGTNGTTSVKMATELDDVTELEVTEDGEKKVEVKDRPEAAKLFSFLQILTAVFGAFAHGGNDVSNGIGPLISIWLVATTGEVATEALTPLWLLAYGGLGISVGLWLWGRRVIQTMGEDLTTVTPSSGFCIELGAAMTVLVASNIGIPISSTHCKVGSVVFVGRLRSKDNVDWSLFRNIVLSWVVTLPACIAFSAAIMALLQLTL